MACASHPQGAPRLLRCAPICRERVRPQSGDRTAADVASIRRSRRVSNLSRSEVGARGVRRRRGEHLGRTPDRQRAQGRFEEFSGIGPKIANNAVENVYSFMRLPVTEIHGADIAPDRHVRRVFLCTGLASRDDLVHMRNVARRLNPDHPADLDYGAWLIGQRFCPPSEVICSACPLDDSCPKHVEPGARIG